jgi:hypothetical protein
VIFHATFNLKPPKIVSELEGAMDRQTLKGESIKLWSYRNHNPWKTAITAHVVFVSPEVICRPREVYSQCCNSWRWPRHLNEGLPDGHNEMNNRDKCSPNLWARAFISDDGETTLMSCLCEEWRISTRSAFPSPANTGCGHHATQKRNYSMCVPLQSSESPILWPWAVFISDNDCPESTLVTRIGTTASIGRLTSHSEDVWGSGGKVQAFLTSALNGFMLRWLCPRWISPRTRWCRETPRPGRGTVVCSSAHL